MVVPDAGQSNRADVLVIVTYVALGLTFVASFMPWATVLVFTVNGTQGDGVLTLILALVAAAFFLGWHIGKTHSKGLLVCAIIATAVAGIVFWYDMLNITRVGHNASDSSDDLFHISVSPGSGLYLGCIATVVAVILQVLIFRRPVVGAQPAATSLSPASPTSAPSGWHVDPTRRHELRYFDGNAWTEHVSDEGMQGVDPIA
jgi:hypothetical protein